METNPKITDMANVSPAQAESLGKGAAQLMQRLLLKDCRREVVDAIKYDEVGMIEQSFGLLGQNAMSDLMWDGSTAAYIEALDQYLVLR